MNTTEIKNALGELDTCVVSDALDAMNLPGATIGIRPLWAAPKIVGRVMTVQIVSRGNTKPTEHLCTSAIENSSAGDVIVVANGGRVDVSCWGDILASAAAQKGIAGVVIDGACRDIDACQAIEFPVFGRAVVPVSARGRIVQQAYQEPVMMAGVRVCPGDFLIADGSGTVFIAAEHVLEVIARASALATRQQEMVEAVRRGRSVVAAMHDQQFDAALKQEPSKS